MSRPKSEPTGDTPALRLLHLLETIAKRDRYVTLPDLVEDTGIPKPTVHRMLQQLESSGMLQREGDTRHYGTGLRLRRLAENVLLNSTLHGGRHTVLSQLAAEIGESCNITALSGDQVLYLDRVETTAPLRFYLHPGSRVPVHCSASGKLFLSQMSENQRRRLLSHSPLERFTDRTLISPEALSAELERIAEQGYAMDNEEFLPALRCIAVTIPRENGRSNLAIAVQAPITRFTPERARSLLPTLHRAARAIAVIDTGSETPAVHDADPTGSSHQP